jgi:replication factor A1
MHGDPQPIVQCVQIKPLPPQNNTDRYRAVFSDINNYIQTMLATRKSTLAPPALSPSSGLITVPEEANHVVRDGPLRRGCFVRLKSFQANSVKGKKLVVMHLQG